MTEFTNYPTIDLVEAPNFEPLTLSDIKIYLRIDGSSEDTILTTMLKSARQTAEAYMKNSIVKQKWKLTFFNSIPETIDLLRGPISSVTSVKLITKDAEETNIAASKYYLNGKHRMCLDKSYSAHKIEVEYYAGFAEDSASIPEIIRQGLLSQIAYIYENRGAGKHALDDSARALFNFYRNIYL